jgi:hypothetical protein
MPPTETAQQRTRRTDVEMDIRRTLLAKVDGRRNLIELESFARALGLAPSALEELRRRGLIHLSPDALPVVFQVGAVNHR